MGLSADRLELLRKDDEFFLYRDKTSSILLLAPVSNRPALESLRKIDHEYSLKEALDPAWAVRPLAISKQHRQPALVLEDPGGETLDRLLPGPLETTQFLRLAVGLAASLGGLHKKELIHKDVKPANILVHLAKGEVRLMGFGIASRLPRERQVPEPPEFIAGTLPYMAPEQTGRMNRSIDSRSDLYALGVTLYEMLTGSLPFSASDPMEWVHCHIARKPEPPDERRKDIPGPVSSIVMKLLAKVAEERYQTATGAASDLQRCLAQWETQRRIDEFPLGQYDIPDRLLIPEKLYGREAEVNSLLACFDRVVASGRPELVLVSGYSGIGKSSVVNELHKPLVPPRGLFASGKFDQYRRDIPYATLAQALQGLLRTLLTKGEAELSKWREALLGAVESNGQLMADLVPELKLVIGDPPPAGEVPLRDAQARFHSVFRRFLNVFARPEHPLAIFLDDLQWLDTATLDLLEDLLTHPDVKHLMLIGAYRDNEVSATHPLARKLEAIHQAGARVQHIVLTPLSAEDLTQLVMDSVHCETERAAPLAQVIHEKTAGNPFFTIQLISVLLDEGLIAFNRGEGQWTWDLNRIHAKGFTDNVVDLMVVKLSQLPAATQQALQHLACLGNSARFTTLQTIAQNSAEEMHAQFWEAFRAGLIFRAQDSYRFLHDRVQDASYSLIAKEQRAEVHLRIGRLLAAKAHPEDMDERVFDIVNQLNRASHLIGSREEREQLAEFNLIAGRRAKKSTALASALTYFAAGRAMLTDAAWDEKYELVFEIEYLTAQCELLTADMQAAEHRLLMLAQRVHRDHDIALVTRLRLTLNLALDRSDRGVEVCLEFLRQRGIALSPRPGSDEVVREYDRIWSLLGGRQVEELLNLPVTTNPDILDVLEVLTEIVTAAVSVDRDLCSLVICRMVNLSIEHGNSDGSCFAYVWLAIIAGPRFGNYQGGFRFGQLGYELVEKRGLTRYQARTYLCFGNIVMPWVKHVMEGRDLVRHAFDTAYRTSDFTFAAYSVYQLLTHMLFAGDCLLEVQAEAEKSLEFARSVRFGLVIDFITTQLQLVRTLRGLTERFGGFNEAGFDESEFELHLANNPGLASPQFGYWALKTQARFVAGDYAAAVDASFRTQRLLWATPTLLEPAEFRFYGALSHAAFWDSASTDEKAQHFEALTAHYKELKICAEHCPANFEDRATLVAAEIARIEGRDFDAMGLYEQAIRAAHANGFVHDEAVAYEVAARFYAARRFDAFADAYLREARYAFDRWGADGKVRQLEQLYPHLSGEEPASSPTTTIVRPVNFLDQATVIKLSQALSGEMVLERLIDTLMRAAIEHAGAQRGLLILLRGVEGHIAAEAMTGGEAVTVHLRADPIDPGLAPESMIRYVMRSAENVILDDALSQNPFSADPYMIQHRVRSVLCLPLITQGKLAGVLYLENNLNSHVFTSHRIVVLKVLASQAAISIENARLFRDLENREAKIRRLVESNILGIVIWNLEGAIVGANEAFLRMVQYSLGEVASGRVRWTDLTPVEWRESDERALADLQKTGAARPYEKELFRKDGSRVPVLAGGALFEEGGSEGVAFVLDLSDQKRAEQSARESNRSLKLVLDGIAGLVAIMNPEGTLEFVNNQVYEYFGRSFEELRDWALSDAVHKDDAPGAIAAWRRSVETGEPYDVDHRLRRADGQYRWFHARGVCLPDAQDRTVRWYVLLTDIDDRKAAEAKLGQSEADLQEAQRLSHTGSWKLDPDSGAVTVTPEVLRLYAVLPDEDTTNPEFFWFHRIHPEDRQRVHDHFERCLGEKSDYEDDYRIVLPDGTLKYHHAAGHPLLSESGALVKFVGTMMDVTEAVSARMNLERAFEEIRTLKDQLYHENLVLKEDIDRTSMFEEIVGSSEPLKRVLNQIAKVAPTDSTVLVFGETGTGKELVARAVHKRSRRSNRAFISVNCGALAPSLISSELFGHEKGAFTGATQRKLGRFELADGGTIFLDEVGELLPDTQAALLRVLQEREFERVGGERPIRVDVRVIAATNRDLTAATAAGTFRQDLFYRLNVFPIEVPPLRERRDDIRMLLEYFVQRYASRARKSFRSIDKKTADLLLTYDWPGNIRELQNVIERSVILSSGDVFSVDELWLSRESFRPVSRDQAISAAKGEPDTEREIIEAALAGSRGRVSGPSGAAAKLRIPPSTLESRIKALKINKSQFKFG